MNISVWTDAKVFHGLGSLEEDVRHVVDDEHQRADAPVPLAAMRQYIIRISMQASHHHEKLISRIVTA